MQRKDEAGPLAIRRFEVHAGGRAAVRTRAASQSRSGGSPRLEGPLVRVTPPLALLQELRKLMLFVFALGVGLGVTLCTVVFALL